MTGPAPEAVDLLAELVAIPSPSGEEEAIARFVAGTARGWGLDVVADDAGVRVTVDSGRPGPALALASHLDTVPAGAGWTRDPWTPVVEGGRLFGRGAGDAKASVAAMLLAARDVAAGGGPPAGRLVVLLGLSEETKDTTMARLAGRAGPLDAAVVGEPTGLDLAVAQRGLLRLDLRARGEQRHAGRVERGAGFVNAISLLARDLVALEGIGAGRAHPLLGETTVTPTMVEAGTAKNVTPAAATAVLDVRTTPAWSHDEILAEVRATVAAEVEVVSERLVPCETPPGSALLAAARRVRPTATPFGSPTCSDWVFLRHLDAVKCGPGTSRLSHAPDESVDVGEVVAARGFYAGLAGAYLGASLPAGAVP